MTGTPGAPTPSRGVETAVLPLATSLVTGLAALATTAAAARLLGPQSYAGFAALWGCFFGVGGAFAGLQQEVTRSQVVARSEATGAAVLARCLGWGLVVGVLAGTVFAAVSGHPGQGAALGAGLVGLSAMTMLGGALVAQDRWREAAAVLVLDALLRTTAVLVVCTGPARPTLLAVAVVIGSVGWLPLLGLASVRRALRTRSAASWAGFAARSGVAMGSASAAALLIAGFPFLLAVAGTSPVDAETGVLVATLVLVRSPLLMVIYAYRPLLLRRLLASTDPLRLALRVGSAGVALGTLATAVAVVVGPLLVDLVAGADYDPGRGQVLAVAASGVLLALHVLTGLTLVVLDRHGGSTAGWAFALAATVAALLLGPSGADGVVLAVLVGPATGVAMHVGTLIVMGRSAVARSVQTQ